jgi:hypothetical protein
MRLTKAEKARIEAERQEFRRVEAIAQDKGYSLHRVILASHPYCVRINQLDPNAYEGTLADIEVWLQSKP